MKLPSRGNVVAIALAGFAVVLAASGTAYAVTTSKVIIGDPVHANFRARVDAKGNLRVGGSVAVTGQVVAVPTGSTIDISSSFGFDGTVVISGVTSATLALSSLSYSNPRPNSSYTGTDYFVSLVQIQAGTAHDCGIGNPGVGIVRSLGSRYVSPGDTVDATYPAPLVVRPINAKSYCLGLSYNHVGGGAQTSLYQSTVQVTGFVAAGSYAGPGSAAVAQRQAPAAVPRLVTR